jgi:hypothetical protein
MINYIKYFILTLGVVLTITLNFSCSEKTSDSKDQSKANQFTTIEVRDTTKQTKADIYFMLGCGYAGTISNEFYELRKLIKERNYKKIKTYLDSTDLKQLLSAIVIDDLYSRKKVALTKTEKEKLETLKSSQKTYKACEGCSGDGFSGRISEIFANKPKDGDFSNVLYNIKFKLNLVKRADT